MEQMIEHLLAMMYTNQAEIKINQEMLGEMKANQAEMLARMEAKMKANLQEIKEELRVRL
jgi:hypothetical protein